MQAYDAYIIDNQGNKFGIEFKTAPISRTLSNNQLEAYTQMIITKCKDINECSEVRNPKEVLGIGFEEDKY